MTWTDVVCLVAGSMAFVATVLGAAEIMLRDAHAERDRLLQEIARLQRENASLREHQIAGADAALVHGSPQYSKCKHCGMFVAPQYDCCNGCADERGP